MSETPPDPDVAEVEPGATDHEVDPDTESDPALGAQDEADWASEGGALEEGPATDPGGS